MIKWVLGFFGLALTLAIFFWWQEVPDISQKINDSKVANYFTALGSIAAAVSIFFLLQQIREMRKSRDEANQPDLYPSDTKMSMREFETLGNLKPFIIPFEIKSDGGVEDNRLYLHIHNIGLGSAKQITVSWIYDREQVKELFDDYYRAEEHDQDNPKTISFVHANGAVSVELPLYYLTCCGKELNPDLLDLLDEDQPQKPALMLRIDFLDIYGTPHQRLFNVQIEAFEHTVTMKFFAHLDN